MVCTRLKCGTTNIQLDLGLQRLPVTHEHAHFLKLSRLCIHAAKRQTANFSVEAHLTQTCVKLCVFLQLIFVIVVKSTCQLQTPGVLLQRPLHINTGTTFIICGAICCHHFPLFLHIRKGSNAIFDLSYTHTHTHLDLPV